MDYTIKNKYLTVTASDQGAELQSLKGADGAEYLWQGDPDVWRDRAPNIFPYVARLTDGKYMLNGKYYSMKIHGLAKYLAFDPDVGQEKMTFTLKSTDQTKEQYPFDFIYRITYSLNENTLKITNAVENTGPDRMYFAVGGHPGFRVPMEEGLSFEDYYLEFDRQSHPYRVGFTDSCFVTGKDEEYPLEDGRRIYLCHDLFEHDAVVLKHAPKTVKIESDRGKRSVVVNYPDFMYVGFWQKPIEEAAYICVEPWSSLPSRDGITEDLSCQSDLIGLDGGRTYMNTWSIQINQ